MVNIYIYIAAIEEPDFKIRYINDVSFGVGLISHSEDVENFYVEYKIAGMYKQYKLI